VEIHLHGVVNSISPELRASTTKLKQKMQAPVFVDLPRETGFSFFHDNGKGFND
jgi:hypothetical protein